MSVIDEEDHGDDAVMICKICDIVPSKRCWTVEDYLAALSGERLRELFLQTYTSCVCCLEGTIEIEAVAAEEQEEREKK
jgi:hypothetical protein